MHCPFCREIDTKVIDSRLVAGGDQVRRRRECVTCGERFTTFESAELVMPRIVKRDGSREPFNEDKLRAGMLRALEKRPVGMDAIEASLNELKFALRLRGERDQHLRHEEIDLAVRLPLVLLVEKGRVAIYHPGRPALVELHHALGVRELCGVVAEPSRLEEVDHELRAPLASASAKANAKGGNHPVDRTRRVAH